MLLVIGGTGRHYPEIYKKVAALAEDASFSRNAEDLQVSISDARMNDIIYCEGLRFYLRLKDIVGYLPDDDSDARKVIEHFEARIGANLVIAPSECTGSDPERLDT